MQKGHSNGAGAGALHCSPPSCGFESHSHPFVGCFPKEVVPLSYVPDVIGDEAEQLRSTHLTCRTSGTVITSFAWSS